MNGNETPDERPDMLGETWDAPDAGLDERLRATFGGVTPLPTPVYGFERVLMRARRRRQRKVWIAVSAAMAVCIVVTGGVTAGLRLANGQVSPAGCDNAAGFPVARSLSLAADTRPSAAAGPAAFDLSAAAPVVQGEAQSARLAAAWEAPAGSDAPGGEDMNRKGEWAIGGVLTAVALGAGIFAGCSASNSNAPQNNSNAAQSPTAAPSTGAAKPTTRPSTSSPSPSGTTTPKCGTEDVSPTVTVVKGSQGAGQELINVTLTNTSGHDCTVYGYPGLGLEDTHQNVQASTAVRDPGSKPTILVRPGAQVSTTVKIDFDVPAGDEPQTGPCEAPSYYMIITPPDQTTSLEAMIGGGPVTVCEHGQMDELPFVPGATGPNQ